MGSLHTSLICFLLKTNYCWNWASQVALVVKNPLANAGDIRDAREFKKIPWRRAWQSTPGESDGQRSLVGCSPQDRKESDTAERLRMHADCWTQLV